MLSLLRALPLIWQLSIGVGALATLGGGYAYWHHKVYSEGEDAAFGKIDASNQKVIDNAQKATRDADDCDNRGGTWDVIDRVCR